MNSKVVTRREFSVQAALVMLGGAVLTISGCGGGSSSPSSPSTPGSGDRTGSISANHGHTATVTAAQLNAGNGLTLDIRGSSSHPHTVTLSGSEVSSIRNGSRVSKESSNDDAHTHTVTFN